MDQLLTGADRALRAMLAPARASRPLPGPAAVDLPASARRQTAAMMRVNHAGEIAAQGLYHGQALVARDPAIRAQLESAAREETDHLAWCEQRLRELNARPSLLDPLWYAGSFAIGALAGLASDKVSLGFVAETERQVEAHLDAHIDRLAPEDARSRAVLEQMRDDEVAHGRAAKSAGGVDLPAPARALMRATAKVMTSTAAWL
ncbi:MAG: 2-polyprenyl-3-methyl-6-methoxy-1,4-benzoquinone monooxygenase [Nevskiaceae bacterium]|jgi:ubiquinone biosynthesis monooxygenase Coq7|nr:2-polyprenyl-3-methyl-6-methoxy-1,4-benzoquinone monooxygenase [Nevskiaceae bacterium]